MTEPEYLYHYQSIQTDIHRLMDLFVYNKLWFSSPGSFNDPFDCKIAFTFNGTFEEFNILMMDAPHDKKNDVDKLFNPQFNSDEQRRAKISQIYKQIFSESIRKLGISCLSEHNSDILMWSHYAYGHQGFCLQFDTALLNKWTICHSVHYNKSFPNIVDLLPNTTYKLLFWKSKHWDYEKEWRCIMGSSHKDEKVHGDKYYDYPPEMLTGVIFGCEMEPENRETIKHLVQSNPKPSHVRFHEAKKKPNEFGLDIEEIK